MWFLLAFAGCCVGPTVDTVPWWKGLPCMVIAPSSLEAMVWRDHLAARHAGETVYGHDGMVLETEWIETTPSGSGETDLDQPPMPQAPEVLDSSLAEPVPTVAPAG